MGSVGVVGRAAYNSLISVIASVSRLSLLPFSAGQLSVDTYEWGILCNRACSLSRAPTTQYTTLTLSYAQI